MDRLIESSEFNLKRSKKSPTKLSGIFAVLDEWNQNKRRYPADVYMGALQEILPKIKERRLLAELDHPIDYDEVRLSNVSHVITECHVKEKNSKKIVYGTVELLNTPSGKIAQALVEAGIPLGISSRAVGNTKNVPGGGVDVTQLKLITYDLVAEPSFASAILSEEKKSELAESLNFIEAKLPLNESVENESVRNSIQRIRESLCLTETVSKARVHIDQSRLDTQTLEIKSLKNILESKNSLIKKDTETLKNSRREIKNLKKCNEELCARMDSLTENHHKLQESYNNLKKSKKLEESKEISNLKAEIIDLRKRLAVEQRGMSYDQVSSLLEGVTTVKDINNKLDMISNFNKRSNTISEKSLDTINESFNGSNRSKLSSIISKI